MNMPKAGYKSVTFSETIYDKINSDYQKNKDELATKGINSLSGYVVSLLAKEMGFAN